MLSLKLDTAKQDKRDAYISLIVLCVLAMVTVIPLMVIGQAHLFNELIKYRDFTAQTCYGSGLIVDYEITPMEYNTTLTYAPATLHMTVITLNRANQGLFVKLTYPTLFERHFGKGGDKTVADVLNKYDELRNAITFMCYIENDQVVGLAGEHSVVVRNYRLTLAGILLSFILGLGLLYILASLWEIYRKVNLGGDVTVRIPSAPIELRPRDIVIEEHRQTMTV